MWKRCKKYAKKLCKTFWRKLWKKLCEKTVQKFVQKVCKSHLQNFFGNFGNVRNFKDFSSKLYFENLDFNEVFVDDTLGFRYCILRDYQLSLAKLSWKWAKKLIILKDFLSRLIIEIRQLNYIPLGLILKRFSRSYLIDLSAKKLILLVLEH